MAWVRIHDGAMTHPKIVGLSDGSFRGWVWGLSYSQMHLTDGFIPTAAMDAKTRRASSDLVKAGLWKASDGGYQIHDYGDWNETRDVVRAKQQKARDRQRRWQDRVSNASPNALENASLTRCDPPVSNGEPNQTIPNQEKSDRARGAEMPNRAVGRSDGVLAGMLPKDHRSHRICSPNFRWCIPAQVHAKFKQALGGDGADVRLLAWYAEVWSGLGEDTVVGDAFRFWQPLFDAKFATAPAAAPPKGRPAPPSNVPSAEETRRRYLS